MKIAYIITSLENGGAEFYTPEIIKVIKSCGHEVTVFVCEPRDRLAQGRFANAGIPYVLMADHNATKVASAVRFAAHLRRSRPDLIWTSLSAATAVGQTVGKLMRIPVVSWKHSANSKFYIRLMKRLSKLWIADSDDVAKYLKSEMGLNPEHTVAWPLFRALEVASVQPKTGIGSINVGSAGRLHRQKNYAALIRSVALIRADTPDVFASLSVTVAGEGGERSRLQRLIDELDLNHKIKLIGFVSDINSYLAKLNVYIQPSLYEGMCIAAHEAMSLGIPVFSTGVGELANSIQHLKTAVLLRDPIEKSLSEAIIEYSRDPERFRRYGSEGRDFVARTKSEALFRANGKKVMEHIEGLLNAKKVDGSLEMQ